MSCCIVWFRNDLRVADNAALLHGAKRSGEVVCVYVLEERAEAELGGASRWWLHHALADLETELSRLGGRLLLRRGPADRVIPEVVEEVEAAQVVWNRRYEPEGVAVDTSIKLGLKANGVEAISFKSNLLFEPHELQTGAGGPYRVFSPFWRACLKQGIAAPLPAVRKLSTPKMAIRSDALADFALLPGRNWDAGFYKAWQPSRKAALRMLKQFREKLEAYPEARDRPDILGTSRISPYLHFGQVSPREIVEQFSAGEAGADKYLSELGWREFAHHLLFHYPHTVSQPLRPEFERFPWREDAALLVAWQRGRTGYPIVDAGMRELWATGWMHNRVRMIVASFLVKHLLQPWQLGAAWFWDTLVDADLASNTLGWQWSAGSGADAAPYFRIFNPVTQGRRFVPEGDYVKHWIPALRRLPAKWVHDPSAAAPDQLQSSGVAIGENYPRAVIGLSEGRERALRAFSELKAVHE